MNSLSCTNTGCPFRAEPALIPDSVYEALRAEVQALAEQMRDREQTRKLVADLIDSAQRQLSGGRNPGTVRKTLDEASRLLGQLILLEQQA